MTFVVATPLSLTIGVVMLALVCVFLLVNWVRWPSLGKSKKKSLKRLPGPTNLPLIGASYRMGNDGKPWAAFSAMRKEFGDIYGLTLGSRRCVVISNMALIKEVLVAKSLDFANRPDFLRFHAIFRGDRNLSIALCDWSEKQKTRREVSFAFMHPKINTMDMTRMNSIIMQELSELVSALSHHQNTDLNARQFLLMTTANIFYQYICNTKFSVSNPKFQQTVLIYDQVFKELFQGFAIDFMPWLKIANLGRLQQLKDLASQVTSVTGPLFDQHEKVIDYDHPKDLIDVFLCHLKENEGKSEMALTKEDAEVIIEDLIGGHSVLGNLWQWGLYLLAGNPHVRQNIRDEVTRVTGNIRAPSMEDRKNMPYTEAATYEILRVISSPIIPHVATRDTSISGYKVAKDTMVMFNTYDMNMDPMLWDKPRNFMPERFLSPSKTLTKPDYFIPFGTGKRTCLGDGLVKSTLFLGLSTLLQHFDITLPKGFPSPNLYEIPGIVVPKFDIQLIFKQLKPECTTTIDMP